MLEIDGSTGEGGGQLVRSAVALSALTATPIRITNARANRRRPGLAAQHLAAVKGVAALCGAQTPGLALHAQRFEFIPERIRGGSYEIDVGTAGSVVLVLQAMVPVALAADRAVDLSISGGTDVHGAPALDYAIFVWQQQLHRLGLRVHLTQVRRGYFPAGGGLVRARIEPGRARALTQPERGRIREITGVAHTTNLPAHILTRMASHAEERLGQFGPPVHVQRNLFGPEQANGSGGAIVLWADCSHALLGGSAVARRGIRAEGVAEGAASSLVQDLESGATLDIHASDQLLIHLAMASGSSKYIVRRVTRHASTILWLLHRFIPLSWEFRESPEGSLRVRIIPGITHNRLNNL